MDEIGFIPISYLNAFVYCKRRFYFEFVLGEMAVNEHVLEGRMRHEISDAGKTEREGDQVTRRRVYVFSESLKLVGLLDVLEEKNTSEGGTVLRPVEYKKGRMGRWIGDRVQLCAQTMCLEELTGGMIDYGYIFYFANRRRERVPFTADLRAQTLEAIRGSFEIAQAKLVPPPLERMAKCRDCSIEPICLPKEVRILRSSGNNRMSSIEGDA